METGGDLRGNLANVLGRVGRWWGRETVSGGYGEHRAQPVLQRAYSGWVAWDGQRQERWEERRDRRGEQEHEIGSPPSASGRKGTMRVQ